MTIVMSGYNMTTRPPYWESVSSSRNVVGRCFETPYDELDLWPLQGTVTLFTTFNQIQWRGVVA